MSATLVFLLLVVASACPARDPAEDGIELPFWAGPGAEVDPRVVRVYDHHACEGRVAVARVKSMPSVTDHGPLEGELVVEFSGTGNVIRRWSIPVDHGVVAVSGDHLLVPHGATTETLRVLSISTKGDLAVVEAPVSAGPVKALTCPNVPEFAGSAYFRCFEFRDEVSSHIRRMGYQGPCT